jgi:hypothetical protein
MLDCGGVGSGEFFDARGGCCGDFDDGGVEDADDVLDEIIVGGVDIAEEIGGGWFG